MRRCTDHQCTRFSPLTAAICGDVSTLLHLTQGELEDLGWYRVDLVFDESSTSTRDRLLREAIAYINASDFTGEDKAQWEDCIRIAFHASRSVYSLLLIPLPLDLILISA